MLELSYTNQCLQITWKLVGLEIYIATAVTLITTIASAAIAADIVRISDEIIWIEAFKTGWFYYEADINFSNLRIW